MLVPTNAGELVSNLSCRGWNGFVDLSVSHETHPIFYTPGDSIELEILVRNQGPDAATNAQVTHLLPNAVKGAEWMCTPSGAAQCTDSGQDGIDDRVDVPVGDSVTYTMVYILPGCCEVESQTSVTPDTDQLEQLAIDNGITTLAISDSMFGDGFEASGNQ